MFVGGEKCNVMLLDVYFSPYIEQRKKKKKTHKIEKKNVNHGMLTLRQRNTWSSKNKTRWAVFRSSGDIALEMWHQSVTILLIVLKVNADICQRHLTQARRSQDETLF